MYLPARFVRWSRHCFFVNEQSGLNDSEHVSIDPLSSVYNELIGCFLHLLTSRKLSISIFSLSYEAHSRIVQSYNLFLRFHFTIEVDH